MPTLALAAPLRTPVRIRSPGCGSWNATTTDPPGAWWKTVAGYPGAAPGIVGELLRASRSVVCDDVEAEQAVAWARAHPAWTDDPPPLVMVDPSPPR
jgi:hypothetical protein